MSNFDTLNGEWIWALRLGRNLNDWEMEERMSLLERLSEFHPDPVQKDSWV